MTRESSFVALRAFRFGAAHLQPGEPVPVEAGRDYRLMLRLGQIAPASVAAPAEPQEPLLTPYPEGGTVLFVADDGTFTFVTFLEALDAPEEVREGLHLKDGDVVASVTFPDNPDNATFVPIGNLLPEHPARLLTDALATWVGKETEWHTQRDSLLIDLADALKREDTLKAQVAGADLQDASEVQALRGDVAFLHLLLRAIRTEGDPLGADFPAAKELQGNGLVSRQGLVLLAGGEQGHDHLVRLDGIGKGRADRIMAALFPDVPPAPDAAAPVVPPASPEG